MSEPFGFEVQWHKSYYEDDEAGWSVGLPHQCDGWDIAGEESHPEPDHAKTVAELERFIAEAQAALDALRAGRTFADGKPGEVQS
jgi:hypothetical protein